MKVIARAASASPDSSCFPAIFDAFMFFSFFLAERRGVDFDDGGPEKLLRRKTARSPGAHFIPVLPTVRRIIGCIGWVTRRNDDEGIAVALPSSFDFLFSAAPFTLSGI